MTAVLSPGGCIDRSHPVPLPVVLPPSAIGYRRSLLPGRGVTVYLDRHPPNEWGEHIHTQLQGAVLLNEITCTVRWRTADGAPHEQMIAGPAVWIVPAGMPHALHCLSEADMATLYMERPFVREALEHDVTEFVAMPLAQLASCDPMAGQLARAFRPLCSEQETLRPFYITSIGETLGAHLLRGVSGFTRRGHEVGGLPPATLRKVVQYIEDHLAEKLRLDALASFAGICRSRLTESFKVSMGHTVCDYIVHRRVEQAQELLIKTDQKEIDIALACGFSDDTALARAFRRTLHCTPRVIRKKQRYWQPYTQN